MASHRQALTLSGAAAWLAHRPLCRMIVALAWVALPAMLASRLSQAFVSAPGGKALSALAMAALILYAFARYVRLVERRAPAELAARPAGAELLGGAALGAAVFTLAIGILAALGVFTIAGARNPMLLLAAIPGAMMVAVFEEIMFRAIVFRALEESFGSWPALVVSGSIFGLMHMGGAESSFQAAIAVTVEAGLLLGVAYMVTRRVWLCIGIHFGWNLTQGALFSLSVSGRAQEGVFISQLTGSPWLTGGWFGVEASLVAVLTCLVPCAALGAYAYKTGKAWPPRRRQKELVAIPVVERA
ncbi:MAG: CPBP family intramembrane glutamic endopeptidase [Pseudomonadota bacterium]